MAVKLIRLIARQFGFRKNVRNVGNQTLPQKSDSDEQYLRQIILSDEHNGQKGCTVNHI